MHHSICDRDIAAVVNVLSSPNLTQGPVVEAFCGSVAKYVGASGAVAVNSATTALHLACRALNLGVGDSVWTSPISFVASANCALMCGASVDFVDVCPASANICPNKLELKLCEAAEKNKLPKIIIPVHFAGSSCNMKKISSLTKKYGIKIIEDASHALGAKHNNKMVGSCEFSDITVFSFHPVKIITTAEGGMVTSNNIDLLNKVKQLAQHGIYKEPQKNLLEPWSYDLEELGYNCRMPDVLAALGLSQLSKARHFVKKRSSLAIRYNEKIVDTGLRALRFDADSSHHLYVLRLNNRLERLFLYKKLIENGFWANVHYKPIHTLQLYKNMGFSRCKLPSAEQHYEVALSIPLYPDLTEKEQDTVIKIIRDTTRKTSWQQTEAPGEEYCYP